MFGGAGSGPLLTAASAWDGLAADLAGAAASFHSVISGVASWCVVGSGVGVDGNGGDAVCAMVDRGGGASRGCGRSGSRGGDGVRVCVRGDRAYPGGVCESCPVDLVNRDELLGSEHAGDRDDRARVPGDVGPGCGRDGGLSRRGEVGGVDVAVVQRSAGELAGLVGLARAAYGPASQAVGAVSSVGAALASPSAVVAGAIAPALSSVTSLVSSMPVST